ncbi:response regulator receiver modulated CheB methylesterase [Candidatus Magnetoovum chiemensis]|nr:response regulator receiver modulated CheB methylesterase [Candidatus Magnetoovum chiemensis]
MTANKNTIKVLIVDDSAFMRNALRSMITSDPSLEVIGAARDGQEAIDLVSKLKPDIVTLDVEMPRMNGLEALRVIMETNPLPVVMVSSLTIDGAKTTLDALDLGAVDFIPKNLSELSLNIVHIKQLLVEKLKEFGSKKIHYRHIIRKEKRQKEEPRKSLLFTSAQRMNIVAIGCSTGGPKALQMVVPYFPVNFSVPVVISQHMPPNFTGPFAQRLDQLSNLKVKEAKEGDKIESGVVYIAPGGGHMSIIKRGVERTVHISQDKNFIYKPSVDLLMLSVAESYPGTCLGVILTGMGNDGLKGMKAIKKSGGRTISQDEDTCVVYGMPKAVVDAGIADKIVPISEIAGEIINSV